MNPREKLTNTSKMINQELKSFVRTCEDAIDYIRFGTVNAKDLTQLCQKKQTKKLITLVNMALQDRYRFKNAAIDIKDHSQYSETVVDAAIKHFIKHGYDARMIDTKLVVTHT